MRNWLLAGVMCLAVACAANAGPELENPAADGGDEATAAATWQALQLADPLIPVDPPLIALPGGDQEPIAGKYKCTPERQDACDGCAAGCQTLCDKPNGGGQAGGCIGLFCPTRCDSCVLGCYKACGKCLPSFY